MTIRLIIRYSLELATLCWYLHLQKFLLWSMKNRKKKKNPPFYSCNFSPSPSHDIPCLHLLIRILFQFLLESVLPKQLFFWISSKCLLPLNLAFYFQVNNIYSEHKLDYFIAFYRNGGVFYILLGNFQIKTILNSKVLIILYFKVVCLGFASKPSGEGWSQRLKQDYLGLDIYSTLVIDT